MTIQFSDDFNGAGDHTNLGDWTVNGAWTVTGPANGFVVRFDTNNLRFNQSVGDCYAKDSTANVGGWVEFTLPAAIGYGLTPISYMVCVRLQDQDNCIGLKMGGTGGAGGRLTSRIAGVEDEAIYQFQLVANTTYRLEDDGTDIRLYSGSSGGTGGTLLYTHTDSTNFTSETGKGVVSVQQDTDSLLNSEVITAYASGTLAGGTDSITLTDFDNYEVVQRSGGATTNVTIGGTYTGTPTAIQYRLVEHGTDTAITGHDWQTLDASPSAGSFSGVVAVADGGWYNVDVRFSNDVGVVDAGVARWGIGAVIGIIGQSHGETMGSTGANLTPDALLADYAGGWAAHSATGDGEVKLGNDLIAALGCPVAIINRSISGAEVATWYTASGGKQTNYNSWETWLTAAGGELEAVIWWQGDRDAILVTSGAQYQTDVTALFAQLRTDYGASLPIIVPYLGRDDAAIDANWDVIRQAQAAIVAADANAYQVGTLDLANEADGQHFTAAAHQVAAARMANIINYIEGGSSYWRGPQIASAIKISSTAIDIAITHDGGSDFMPTTGITGFQVTDDDWSTTKTISGAVRQDASTIRLTLSTALSGTAKIRYQYGGNPDKTGAVVDNAALALPLEYAGEFQPPVRAVVTLVDEADAAEANLTGLKWAFFDEITPDLLAAPVDQGSVETTDASGVLDIPIPNSSKVVGGIGWLIVSDSDGTTTQTPAHKAFSGPVELIQ